MKDFSKILCVIDPDSEAQPALDRAAWLAKHVGADVELLICYYNEYLSDGRLGGYPSLENAREDILEGFGRRLEALAEPLRKDGTTVTTATSRIRASCVTPSPAKPTWSSRTRTITRQRRAHC